MWGNITLDFLYAGNYNFGFPTTRTDVLLRITHWQYWWWFWFTYLTVLYYFLFLRILRFRTLKFKPKIATTYRSHGKWGDLIVCLLPISWCVNILSNSNMILRMMEWQANSCLFTVRIRGKQWYWIYKFEVKTVADVMYAPRSSGHSKWSASAFNELTVADSYLHIIQLRAQNTWVREYWDEIYERYSQEPDFYMTVPQDFIMAELREIKNTIREKYGYKDSMFTPPSYHPEGDYLEVELNNEVETKETKFFSKLEQTVNTRNSGEPYKGMNFKTNLFPENDIYLSKLQNKLPGSEVLSKTDLSDLNLNFNPDMFSLKAAGFEFSGKERSFADRTYTTQPWYYNYLFFKKYDTQGSFGQNKGAFTGITVTPNEALLRGDEAFMSSRPSIENIFSQFLPDRKPTPHCYHDAWDVNRWFKETDELKLPLRLIKNSLKYTDFNNLEIDSNSSFKLFRFKYNDEHDIVEHKVLPHKAYMSFKQKRYQHRDKFLGQEGYHLFKEHNTKKISFFKKKTFDSNLFGTLNLNQKLFKSKLYSIAENILSTSDESFSFLIKNYRTMSASQSFDLASYNKRNFKIPHFFLTDSFSDIKEVEETKPLLIGNKLLVDNIQNAKRNYHIYMKNRKSDESTHSVLSRRLLRVKRTLVLPAYVNIAAVTNSYDVVHSWFIPGLGLKLDCIPGRCTHHVLHIDNVGFYYGQCAEICGRYHHHMPVRVCALPFEHFLVWWHNFGLPRMMHPDERSKFRLDYFSKKYAW